MKKLDELASPNSCLNKAKDTEWLFVLLERDPCAADTVRYWAEQRVRRGINKVTDQKIIEAHKWCDVVLQIKRIEI